MCGKQGGTASILCLVPFRDGAFFAKTSPACAVCFCRHVVLAQKMAAKADGIGRMSATEMKRSGIEVRARLAVRMSGAYRKE